LAELKAEYEARNVDNLDAAIEKLNNVFQAASQEMYSAANADGSAEGASTESTQNAADEVTDVDFEEVNDKK